MARVTVGQKRQDGPVPGSANHDINPLTSPIGKPDPTPLEGTNGRLGTDVTVRDLVNNLGIQHQPATKKPTHRSRQPKAGDADHPTDHG